MNLSESFPNLFKSIFENNRIILITEIDSYTLKGFLDKFYKKTKIDCGKKMLSNNCFYLIFENNDKNSKRKVLEFIDELNIEFISKYFVIDKVKILDIQTGKSSSTDCESILDILKEINAEGEKKSLSFSERWAMQYQEKDLKCFRKKEIKNA